MLKVGTHSEGLQVKGQYGRKKQDKPRSRRRPSQQESRGLSSQGIHHNEENWTPDSQIRKNLTSTYNRYYRLQKEEHSWPTIEEGKEYRYQ